MSIFDLPLLVRHPKTGRVAHVLTTDEYQILTARLDQLTAELVAGGFVASQAFDDAATLSSNTIESGSVFANDVWDVTSDPPHVSFFFVHDSQVMYQPEQVAYIPGVGALTIDVDGIYTFTPNEDWVGVVPNVTYTTDHGTTASLTLTAINTPLMLWNKVPLAWGSEPLLWS